MKINRKKADAAPAAAEDNAAAKPAKAAKGTAAKASNLPAKEEYKYDVNALADRLGIKAASARVQLRNHEVPKAGKSYGWNTDKEFEAVVKQLTPDAKVAKKAGEDAEVKAADKASKKSAKKAA